MKKATLALVLALVMMAAPSLGFAASPWMEGETYGEKVSGKLEFGIKNLLGGWTELITQPRDAEANGINILEATGRGIFDGVIYTVGGAVHAATFLIPIDIELPNNGVQF